jgi:hypothetical protein
MNRLRRFRGIAVFLFLTGVLLTLPAFAQTTAGVLRGTVKDENGGTLAGVTVDATNDDTGIIRTAVTGADGFYNLAVPPDSYTVKASLPNLGAETKKVIVILGQAQALDFVLSVKSAQQVTVTAQAPVIDTQSNEVATNVSEQQLRSLPQDNRNFLNFAALAPGMHTSTDVNRQEVSSGANEAFNANVFIDGTSYKNDVLLGGIVGQDSSRGNPFPQNAVQEFRVITQNFKAEYEKSSSNVITAVTKSGSNEYQGTAFAEYQNKDLVAQDPFAAGSAVKPDYTRWQAGVSLGGPIMKDAVHFFASWELNQQDYSNRVFVGSQIDTVPEPLKTQLEGYQGIFPSPFTENLLFGKVSWQVAQGDVLDTSGFWRKESNVRDFGAQRSYEAATDIKQNIWNAQVQNQWLSSKYLSVTTVGYQNYQWNPVAVNPSIIGQDYENVIRIGGQDSSQNFHQKVFSVREDFTLLDLHGFGDHVVKAGVIANFAKYDVQKLFTLDPVYSYNEGIVGTWDFPYQARYGFGNPDLSSSNNQYGIYLQDDWAVNSRLTVNVGLRWDYETNGLDNTYITPPSVYNALKDFYPASYFTDGNQRPNYAKAFQPRVGFTFDITGKGETIAFGGAGIYVDRDYYNALLDERFRLQYSVLNFQFSADGQPRNGQSTIVWNDSYLTADGLNGIIASGNGPKPEAFLINNGTGLPTTNQYSAGLRQRVGLWGFSAAWAGAWSRNGFTYVWGDVGGRCCQSPSPDFQNVLLSDATKKAQYNALLVNIDKQYTASSPWGLTVAYTYGKAQANGGDLFTLDYINVAASPYHRTPQDQRNLVVLSGIVGLPWDSKFTTVLQLGSGTGFTIADCTAGYGPGECKIKLNDGTVAGTLPYQSWDMGLQKDFYLSGQTRIGARIEVFNVTNHYNYGCYDGFIPKAPDVNANYGKPGCIVTQPRRLQFGIGVGF